MPSIYDYATGPAAELGPPPDAWVLRGQASNLPYIAGYDNWLSRGILDELALHGAHYDPVEDKAWLADYIFPMTNYATGDITGIYLNRSTSAGVKGIKLHTKGNDLQLFVEDSGGTDKHNWLFADDGTVQIGQTLGVYNFLVGLDATTKLRYGYASTYPTFEYDHSPLLGGWSLTNATSVWTHSPAGADTSWVGAGAPTITAYAVCPLPELSHDTGRTTETVFELVNMSGYIGVVGATSLTIDLMRRDRNSAFANLTSVATITTTGAAGLQATTPGTPLVLNTNSYVYFLQATAVDIGDTGAKLVTIGRVWLQIRKRAVE